MLEIHNDDGLVGIGMTMPYYGTPPAPANDLIGKAIGWPLCRIFGGKLQNRILVDYWTSRMSPEDSANAAKLAASQGFHGIKMKCSAKDGNVVDRTFAVHEAAHELRIVLDPNERFDNLRPPSAWPNRLRAWTSYLKIPSRRPTGRLTESSSRGRTSYSRLISRHLCT